MNRFTTALEQASVRQIGLLRGLQIGAFMLALANFGFIVVDLLRRHQSASESGVHWQQEALRDPLTRLFNRAAFFQRLNEALAHARLRPTAGLAVLMLDLDNFKPINDVHGHKAGDAALHGVAACLQSLARENDTVARLGGDEFALVCPDIHTAAAVEDIRGRILQRLQALQVAGLPDAGLAASVGAALFPADGASAEALLASADRAMYANKRAQKNHA
jgi:diguanylate cyclase (GGDEF)-like protein